MPGLDRMIDWRTGDYIDDGSGGTEYTPTIATQVYHQIQGRLGDWVGDDEAGSRLFELGRSGNDIETLDAANEILKSALKPFIDDGSATDLQTEVVEDENKNRMALHSEMRDAQYGDPMDLSPLLPTGV